MTPFLSFDWSVTAVPTLKLADAVWPLETLNPEGVDVTVPQWPVTVSVSVTVVSPPPQTLAIPPPPQDCGLVQDPQVRVPPQPSETEPQFLPCAEQLIGVQPLAAFTVRIAFTVSPRAAEIWSETVPAVKVVVLAVKLPLLWPAATVMVCGTVTKLLVLERPTSAPPLGAAMFNVTVPSEEFPAVTVLGFRASVDTANTDGPH